ncbi:Rossmann-like and DUF2520 domain-containing protein [Galbibacter mesophilus]|uniref:Rossmann-like and DUF2520 domain-containing protein n=1 Tax=Galbibacter mesophilus TaxID=379069 RepID=UPI00191E2441|nr:DUF2520 domain-containing protein [Galbibacter mesophilus]MCM5663365.1 DUF2520 domain-containing protein [Galbibacter mesophilus]
MIKVVLLGGGNVAHHLHEALRLSKEVDLVQCFSRNIKSINVFQNFTPITKNLNELKEADVYIIAVSDDAISEVSEAIPFSGKFVVHTSGNKPLNVLSKKNKRGVFYPLQTFSKGKEMDYSKIPFCLETEDERDYNTLKIIAESISQKVFKIDSEQRKSLHLAAVFVNNFVNHLYKIGDDICQESGIPFEILQPLIEETSEKVKEMQPLEAQTGPARRNDVKTLDAHKAQMKSENQIKIYELLTDSIQETYGRKKL